MVLNLQQLFRAEQAPWPAVFHDDEVKSTVDSTEWRKGMIGQLVNREAEDGVLLATETIMITQQKI